MTQQASETGGGGKITPWEVAKRIPGSVGSVDKIAREMRVSRVELRRFINDNPELKEAMDDEILAAQERVIEKTYEDCMEGSAAARQDFFKMIGGYFNKNDKVKAGEAQPQIVIHLEQPGKTYKMLAPDGEIVDVNRDDLMGAQPPGGDVDGGDADRDFDDPDIGKGTDGDEYGGGGDDDDGSEY